MNRIQMAVAAVMLLCSRCALAQPVFFDDFDGDDLKPYWKKPPPNQWTYTVANSLLSVTHAKDGLAYIYTTFDPLGGDSEASAVMGWEDSDDHDRELAFAISAEGKWLAWFSFTEKFDEDLVRAGVPGGPYVQIPAPPAGMHDFVILRHAGEFHFLLNDALVAVLPDSSGDPMTGVSFDFPVVGTIEPLMVDRVQVVPAPGAMIMLFAGACASRRTRRST